MPTVLVGVERHAVVGGHDDRRLVVEADLLDPVEDPADERIGVARLQQVPLPLQVLDPRHAAIATVDRQVGLVGGRGVQGAVGEVAPREVRRHEVDHRRHRATAGLQGLEELG